MDFNILEYNENGIILPNQVGYRIEPLLQTYVETTNNQGNGAWTITQPNSYAGFTFKIRNVTISANVHNENEINDGETYYNFEQDTGDVLSFVQMPYRAFYDEAGETKEFLKWAADFVLTKGLDKLSEAEIPYASAAARIVGKIIGYAKEGKAFFDALSTIPTEPEIITNQGNGNILGQDYLPKYGVGSQYELGKFARNVYLHLQDAYVGENNEHKAAYLAPSLNATMNEDGELIQENGYVDLIVRTQGEVSNSRIALGASFEVIYDQLGDSVLIQNTNGEYAFVPIDSSGIDPVLFVQSMEHKVYRKSPVPLQNEDTGYLLDGQGYMLYTFQPKAGDDFVFGDYRFYTRSIQTMVPSTRIHIFKTTGNAGTLTPETLIRMTREQLLAHPYLLAYNHNNNVSSDHTMQLDYTFEENYPDANNSYYILYKFSFDYLYGASYFGTGYDFMPPALTFNIESNTFVLNSGQKTYFSFEPASSGNFTIEADSFDSVRLELYDAYMDTCIAGYDSNALDVLLTGDETYIIAIENLGTNTSGTLCVRSGEIVDGNTILYTDLKINEIRVFRYSPSDFSGSYKTAGDIGSLTVFWYDEQLDVICEDKNASVFLSKNGVYYIQIINQSVSAQSGEIEIEYQFDEVVFNASVQIETDEHKMFWAYTIEAANVGNATVYVDLYLNNSAICSGHSFIGDKFIFDLTPYIFNNAEQYHFNATLTVITDTDEYEYTLDAIQIQNLAVTHSPDNEYNNEYTHLTFDMDSDYVNNIINIPSSVKMLTIEANSYNIRGLGFNVATSTIPLIINIKNVNIYAPTNMPTVKSSRDIILNCFGTVTLVGGNGIDDEFYLDLDGDPAVEMQDNLLVVNGSGTLNLTGGNGGNTSDGQDFYYNDTAGAGGTAVEVGDLVININTMVITGGNGGDGGDGLKGLDGADGVGQKENGVGQTGEDGEYGGYASGGGNAGMGIWIVGQKCVIYSQNLTISGGIAGNGGKGGDGGNGGNGGPGKDGGVFGGQCGGGNGGRGGNGCYGGSYGTGMVAFNTYDLNKIINLSGVNYDSMLSAWTADGTGGAGGKGGKGGTGGPGGKSFWGSQAPNGTDGEDGFDGAQGGDPRPYAYMTSTRANACSDCDLEMIRLRQLREYIIERLGAEIAASKYDF